MRNYLLILAILFTNYTFAQWTNKKYTNIEPATLVATYTLHYQPDSTNLSWIRTSTLILLMGPNVSEIVDKAAYINDTLTRKFTTKEQIIDYLANPKAIRPNILYSIYPRLRNRNNSYFHAKNF